MCRFQILVKQSVPSTLSFWKKPLDRISEFTNYHFEQNFHKKISQSTVIGNKTLFSFSCH